MGMVGEGLMLPPAIPIPASQGLTWLPRPTRRLAVQFAWRPISHTTKVLPWVYKAGRVSIPEGLLEANLVVYQPVRRKNFEVRLREVAPASIVPVAVKGV